MKPELYEQVREDRAADTTEERIQSEAYDQLRDRAWTCQRCGAGIDRKGFCEYCGAPAGATMPVLSNEKRAFLIVETEGTEIVDIVERADDRQSAIGFLLQCDRPTVDLLCRAPDGSYRFASYLMPDPLTQLNRSRAAMTLCNAAIYVLKSDWDGATVKAANERIQRAYDELNLAAQVARVKQLRRARYLLEAAESVLSARLIIDGPRQHLAGEIRQFLKTFGR